MEFKQEINIDKEIQVLQQKGYIVLGSFISFYKEFENLYFDIKVNDIDRVIDFNLNNSFFIEFDSVIINNYPKLIDFKSLNPIGNINKTSCLAIDENGVVYSLYDGLVSIKGKGKEAVDNLLTKEWREFEELPIPDWW